ncbi:unnamed protein product [Pleuronectes platessa]|uniref:Reticulon n=1 Tax=Pleuronectes platessa TaxID=8262 RepID=A0A9N7W0G1_PLEPL|nr:unnamed protein product [Pleuronectes platessa]
MEREQDIQPETITIQPSPPNLDTETQERDTGIQREESDSRTTQIVQPPSPALSSQQQRSTQLLDAASLTPEPESPVIRETISVKLLTSGRPRVPAPSPPATVSLNSQEQLVNDHWFSALKLSEDLTVCIHIAVMDLIYWKDTERTGMVLTGLVVGLLTLFQLSIITVFSTASLAVVCVTISMRIYYHVLHALKWGDGVHPFKSYLDLDISFSGEQAELYMQKAIVMTLSAVDTLKRLVFVGNLFDSLKCLSPSLTQASVCLCFLLFLSIICHLPPSIIAMPTVSHSTQTQSCKTCFVCL